MKEIKNQTDGKIYDRQAWFQIIPVDDMVTEKSGTRSEKIQSCLAEFMKSRKLLPVH